MFRLNDVVILFYTVAGRSEKCRFILPHRLPTVKGIIFGYESIYESTFLNRITIWGPGRLIFLVCDFFMCKCKCKNLFSIGGGIDFSLQERTSFMLKVWKNFLNEINLFCEVFHFHSIARQYMPWKLLILSPLKYSVSDDTKPINHHVNTWQMISKL